MNRDTFKGQWKQIKGEVKRRWGMLTDDEVDQADGNFDKLVGRIQERYGYQRDRPSASWPSSLPRKRPALLEVDHDLESTEGHALHIEGHGLRVHHLRHPRIFHNLRIHAVAMGARLVENPRKEDCLAWLCFREARKWDPHFRFKVLADALHIVQRAMFLPDPARRA